MDNTITTHEEWLKARLKGIGASEASAIIGCNPYMSNVDLWKIKTGRKKTQDISSNAHVQYGHNAESPLRQLFALDYPQYKVEYFGEFDMVYNSAYPFIFATLDGRLTEKETSRKGVYEGKTTEILRSMQKEKWNDCIPNNYFVQVLHQLISTGWDFAYLNAQLKRVFDGEVRTETRRYKIERKDVEDDINYLLKEEITFWEEYVLKDKCPPLRLPEI